MAMKTNASKMMLDPLVSAYREYIAAVEAFDNDLAKTVPDEEWEGLAERTYDVYERKLTNPGKIESVAGAHALLQYLVRDNEFWGQKIWAPMLAALEDYLRRQAEAESKGGRSNG